MLKMFLAVLITACTPTIYDHGIPNLHQVDVGVWRTGQITTAAGWTYLQQITHGKRIHIIKLNFANEGSDALATAAGYDVHDLAIQPQGDQSIWDDVASAFKRPDPKLIDAAEVFLATATSDDVWIVHCTHGMDRTGLVVGMHRVLHDHWTKEAAYAEMLKYNFHPELHGVHEAWEDFNVSASALHTK